MRFHEVVRTGVLTFALAAPLACGDPGTPEERLAAAGETLSDARVEASDANAALAEARGRLGAAEAELYEARKALRNAERRVLSAEARLERRATDVALFRKIQSQLLAAEALRHDAVTVRVEEGTVTLDGAVATEAGREFALRTARNTPGVTSVRDRLDVESQEAG